MGDRIATIVLACNGSISLATFGTTFRIRLPISSVEFSPHLMRLGGEFGFLKLLLELSYVSSPSSRVPLGSGTRSWKMKKSCQLTSHCRIQRRVRTSPQGRVAPHLP